MENNGAWQEIWETKERLGIDEELFYTIVYDCMTIESSPTTEKIVRYLTMFMAHDFDGDPALWRKDFHAIALEQLEQDIAELGLPVRRTANEMARREFGVDDARWLRCWQLAKLVYLLSQKNQDRPPSVV